MEPAKRYPIDGRFFLTSRETADIGTGIMLWRGYFQSVRPAMGRMHINVDISTAATYKPGRLIDISLEVLSAEITLEGPFSLSPARGLPELERRKLQSFLRGVYVNIDIAGRSSIVRRWSPRIIRKLTMVGADQLSMTTRQGGTTTIAQYFEKVHNVLLLLPDIVCIEVSGIL